MGAGHRRCFLFCPVIWGEHPSLLDLNGMILIWGTQILLLFWCYLLQLGILALLTLWVLWGKEDPWHLKSSGANSVFFCPSVLVSFGNYATGSCERWFCLFSIQQLVSELLLTHLGFRAPDCTACYDGCFGAAWLICLQLQLIRSFITLRAFQQCVTVFCKHYELAGWNHTLRTKYMYNEWCRLTRGLWSGDITVRLPAVAHQHLPAEAAGAVQIYLSGWSSPVRFLKHSSWRALKYFISL